MTSPDAPEPEPTRDVTQPRPNPSKAYRCGHDSPDLPCSLGPTSAGKCCLARRIKGETGSSGDQDVCVPVANPWRWRNLISINLATLATGILAFAFASRDSESVFAPGTLSKSHTQILGNTLGAARCGQCHPTSHSSGQRVTQEQLCMNCHKSTLPDAIHGFAHDIAPERWVKLVSAKGKPDFKLAPTENTRCAQCHQEHHGDSQSLREITDARCQSCHQQQFASFNHGHPEFKRLAKSTARRIAFDHQSHFDKYFAQNNATMDCRSCHDADPTTASGMSRSVSFERACVNCHEAPLRASIVDGWAVIQLPSLKPHDIQSGEADLTGWPAGAQYGYDGPITLAMRMLLADDPIVAKALSLFPDGDLSKIDPNDARQQEAARIIASGVRQLLAETAAQGQQAWQQRLTSIATKVLNHELSDNEAGLIRSMVAGLPPDLFRQIQLEWFGQRDVAMKDSPTNVPATLVAVLQPPNDELLGDSDRDLLGGDEDADELLRSSSTEGIAQTPSSAPTTVPASEGAKEQPAQAEPKPANKGRLTGAARLASGGWYLDPQVYSLRYKPQGHSDPVVAAWIQFAALIDARVGSSDWHAALKLPNWSSEKIAVGQCTQCHLLSTYTNESVSTEDWQSIDRGHAKGFTRFNHQPHLMLADTVDCKHCHRLGESTSSGEERFAQALVKFASESPGDRNSHLEFARKHFSGEFESIEKSQCSICHRNGGAPQGCTQCHNYHVNQFEP